MTASHWIPEAEAALDHRGDTPSVEVVQTSPLPLLQGSGARAASTPFFAAFVWAAAIFQEQLAGQPLAPLALLLRFLGLALVVRTVLGLRLLLHRVLLRRQRDRYGLALSPEGLLVRTPDGDVAVPKRDVLAIREQDALRQRSDRYAPVYVVTRPGSGRTHVALPPIFDHSPRALAERLMRWLGPVEIPADFEPQAPSRMPSKIYDAAARGEFGPGVVALRHGSSWLRRAPYATVLLGIAIAEGFLRMDDAARQTVGPVAAGLVFFSLLLVPLGWMLVTRFDIAPRKGLSIVLTPGEAIMRTRAGVHVVAFRRLRRATVRVKRSWSLLRGPFENRFLVLARDGDDDISYAESFLGEPAEVVASLCSAYRKGQLQGAGSAQPEAQAEAEQE